MILADLGRRTGSSAQHIGAVEHVASPASEQFIATCDAALEAGGWLAAQFDAVIREQAGADRGAEWMYPFDHGRLAAYRGTCLLALGCAADAEAAFSEAIASLPERCAGPPAVRPAGSGRNRAGRS